MRAGAKGHAGVHDDPDAVRPVILPAGHDGEALADVHSVVVLLPGVLPVLLLDAGGVELVADAAVFQPLLKQGQHLGGVLVRGKVHVNNDDVTRFVQQVLFNQVNVGDLPRLLLQVAVVLNINAAVGDHRCDGLGSVGVALGDGDADVSPFHVGGSFDNVL